MSRSQSENRCEKCSLFNPLCICALSPNLTLDTRVVIVMHIREIPLTTNTARLATLSLTNSELRLRGVRGEELDCRDIPADSEYYPVVLFPSEDAIEITPEWAAGVRAQGKKISLVVPDGNWKQCSKVSRRVAGLENLPRVKLPLGRPSEYILRKEPRPECLCTFEAVIRALGILHGRVVEEELYDYFRLKQDRVMWARGVLPTDQVRGGVPQAAIDSFHIAGARGRALSPTE